MQKALLSAAAVFLLTGCKPLIDQMGVKPEQRPEAMPQGYGLYEEGVVGNGAMAVLFFFSADDPASLLKDEELRTLYAQAEVPLMTYRVTFGADAALEQRYGVTKADTFVLIDEAGDAVKKETGASFTAVKRLLYRNIETAKPAQSSSSSRASQAAAEPEEDDDIENFEDCVAAGYPVMKSYPAQCATAGGKHFVEQIEEDQESIFGGKYTAYTDGVIGNGSPAVLFFHAAWCPYCVAHDGNLTGWYRNEVIEVSTYKIDFDTAAELKKRFGVTQQDTFILIDGQGNEVNRLSFPSEKALRDLLG